MAGFLPTGTGGVSLFWSIRLDRIDGRARARACEAFRDDLFSLVPQASFLALTRWTSCCRPSYRQVSLPRWHDAQLVLLGDAAHALSPQLGQGANLALMDAAALADAAVARRRSRPRAAPRRASTASARGR